MWFPTSPSRKLPRRSVCMSSQRVFQVRHQEKGRHLRTNGRQALQVSHNRMIFRKDWRPTFNSKDLLLYEIRPWINCFMKSSPAGISLSRCRTPEITFVVVWRFMALREGEPESCHIIVARNMRISQKCSQKYNTHPARVTRAPAKPSCQFQ